LANRTFLAISKLRVGDKVLARNPKTGVNTSEVVTATMIHDDFDLMGIVVKTSTGTGTISATDLHPFWDATKNSWTVAENLVPGDELQTSNGSLAIVVSTQQLAGNRLMWDLTVSVDHDFYVSVGAGSQTAVLVHNCLNASARALQHIQDTHFEDGPDFNPATKGMFTSDEDPAQLIADAADTEPTTLSSGAQARTVWAGRLVGYEQGTGQGTSLYTVISNSAGKVMTAYPGVPS
jgi:hypothetical protein